MLTSSAFDATPQVVPARHGLRLQVFKGDTGIARVEAVSFVDDIEGFIVTTEEELDLRPQSAADLLTEVVRRSEQVVRRHPRSGRALRALASAVSEAGDHPRAETLLRQTVELEPDSPGPLAELARTLTAQGRFSEANGIYEALARHHTGSVAPLVGLADVSVRERRFDDAVRYLRKALAETDQDDDGQLSYLLGVALLLTTNPANYAAAIHHLRQATRSNPRLAPYHHALAVAYALNGSDERALNQFMAAHRQLPTLVESVHAIAAIHGRQGRTSDAKRLLVESLRRNPDDYRGRELLASILVEGGEHRSARAELFRALLVLQEHGQETTEAFSRITNNLGVCYRYLKDLGEAERMFRRSIEAYPQDPGVPTHNLARLLIERHRSGEAVAILTPWVDRSQDTTETALVLAHAYYDLRRNADAIEVLQRALDRALEPPVELFAVLSSLQLDHDRDYERSVELLLSALKIHGPHARIVNNLAYAYLMLDRVDEASALLRRLPHPDVHLESPELTATWGLLALRQGDPEEARRLYQLAGSEAARAGKARVSREAHQKYELELARWLAERGDPHGAMTHVDAGLRIQGRPAFHEDLLALQRRLRQIVGTPSAPARSRGSRSSEQRERG